MLHYLDGVNFTEPLFVVVIMAIASTRPVVRFTESCLRKVAMIGGCFDCRLVACDPFDRSAFGIFHYRTRRDDDRGTPFSQTVYYYKPSETLKYATIGLLFVNVSVGGTLTHFAAPPVVMVAGKWDWTMGFMFTNFGWKATLGIIISTLLYFVMFRKEFSRLARETSKESGGMLTASSDTGRPQFARARLDYDDTLAFFSLDSHHFASPYLIHRRIPFFPRFH